MSTVKQNEDRLVKCCDCNDIHKKSDRMHTQDRLYPELAITIEICPECKSVDYYEL